jgi:hypothetical protein
MWQSVRTSLQNLASSLLLSASPYRNAQTCTNSPPMEIVCRGVLCEKIPTFLLANLSSMLSVGILLTDKNQVYCTTNICSGHFRSYNVRISMGYLNNRKLRNLFFFFQVDVESYHCNMRKEH